ncbi:hypothetical protein F5I97DRAFT_1915402, partial [Phlebopus sp. FC_14]
MFTITRQSESTHVTTDINVLHRRLGHIDHDSIRRMVSRGYVEGVDSITGKEDFCESCIQAKMKKLPFHHVKFREWQNAVEPLLQTKAKSMEFSRNWARIFCTDN